MSLECDDCIIARHAFAVVDDPDQLFPSGLDCNIDSLGSSIERILEKFFDYGCGPLDDLSCRNFVGQGVWKDFYLGHSVSLSNAKRSILPQRDYAKQFKRRATGQAGQGPFLTRRSGVKYHRVSVRLSFTTGGL